MSIFGISSRRLHKRSWRLDDGSILRASIFPFFEPEGFVRQLMIADWKTGRISVVPARSGMVKLAWFSANRLHVTQSQLQEVTDSDQGGLLSLWHVDPWWVLTDIPFSEHDAVPLLRCTNAVSSLGDKRSSVFFARDFSRVAWMARNTSGETTIRRWSSDVLPHSYPKIPDRLRNAGLRRRGGSSWVLNPPWAHVR